MVYNQCDCLIIVFFCLYLLKVRRDLGPGFLLFSKHPVLLNMVTQGGSVWCLHLENSKPAK